MCHTTLWRWLRHYHAQTPSIEFDDRQVYRICEECLNERPLDRGLDMQTELYTEDSQSCQACTPDCCSRIKMDQTPIFLNGFQVILV